MNINDTKLHSMLEDAVWVLLGDNETAFRDEQNLDSYISYYLCKGMIFDILEKTMVGIR
ncbi:MAG: hypothetical protein LLF98_04340 [Clostridium sp.]|uniref:hypothetical protein n=1 Tax=Clostridium sp. TaxID=1506 RepID=UPI0025B92866|nr:hypothetical protein [Clostridium sp.]MCE5220505.1 hypothetical protein [Clostridium sp.]